MCVFIAGQNSRGFLLSQARTVQVWQKWLDKMTDSSIVALGVGLEFGGVGVGGGGGGGDETLASFPLKQ